MSTEKYDRLSIIVVTLVAVMLAITFAAVNALEPNVGAATPQTPPPIAEQHHAEEGAAEQQEDDAEEHTTEGSGGEANPDDAEHP